jgi:hypothetical protein
VVVEIGVSWSVIAASWIAAASGSRRTTPVSAVAATRFIVTTKLSRLPTVTLSLTNPVS